MSHDWSTANAFSLKELGVGITDFRLAQDLDRERVKYGKEPEDQPSSQGPSGQR
jgi:hypothetical protein